LFFHHNLDRTFDDIPTNKKSLGEIHGRSIIITYCSKVALTSQRKNGAKERRRSKQEKQILQNAFIRIQFLYKFKYFCPLLKTNVAL
jgi:ribosomal protein L13